MPTPGPELRSMAAAALVAPPSSSEGVGEAVVVGAGPAAESSTVAIFLGSPRDGRPRGGPFGRPVVSYRPAHTRTIHHVRVSE